MATLPSITRHGEFYPGQTRCGARRSRDRPVSSLTILITLSLPRSFVLSLVAVPAPRSWEVVALLRSCRDGIADARNLCDVVVGVREV